MITKLKPFFAFAFASALTLSMFGCAKPAKDEKFQLDPELKKKLDTLTDDDELLGGELKNKTIKWMSNWDINKEGDVPVDLALFKDKYGGNIEFYNVTYEERYDKLAQAIQSGEGIDFFSAGDGDAFPKGAVRNMFVPVDDYIDFNSPLWADVKQANDSLLWNGKHYVSVVSVTGDSCAVIYNRNTIAENGFTDPAELYAQGKWDWNAFESMLTDFVDTDNQRYGLDGWWFEFGLINTTGVPPVSLENQKLVNNLGNPAMERVQNWIEKLYNKNLIAIGVGDYGWDIHPSYIGEGKQLFYPGGLYNFYCPKNEWVANFGEEAFFVPMPKDPNASEYYVPTGMDSYVMVSGGKNPEGVAKYLNCKRYTLMNEEIKAIADKQMVDTYGWTDEMVDMSNELKKLANDNPAFDVSKGVSADCGQQLDDCLRYTARGIASWSSTYASINPSIDLFIEEINAKSEQN